MMQKIFTTCRRERCVYEVAEGSAAEAAGIKKGDIITKFDGMSVSGFFRSDLIKMSYYKVGETVTVEVQTANGGDYEIREVEVTLQEGGNDVQGGGTRGCAGERRQTEQDDAAPERMEICFG